MKESLTRELLHNMCDYQVFLLYSSRQTRQNFFSWMRVGPLEVVTLGSHILFLSI